MMCGEMQFEGAFAEGNARVSCSEAQQENYSRRSVNVLVELVMKMM